MEKKCLKPPTRSWFSYGFQCFSQPAVLLRCGLHRLPQVPPNLGAGNAAQQFLSDLPGLSDAATAGALATAEAQLQRAQQHLVEKPLGKPLKNGKTYGNYN